MRMMLGSDENEALVRMGMMSGFPLQANPAAFSPEMTAASGSQRKDDRVAQWSHQETRDFIATRAALERDFTVAQRNKTLWEAAAAKMKEKGYRRTPDQCKCKWQNLVNRYKGKEASDPENGSQCLFFDELHAILTERAKNKQRMLLESVSGGGQVKTRMKKLSDDRSSDDFSDEEESDKERVTKTRKRKIEKEKQRPITSKKSKPSSSIHELLQDFLQQQQGMAMQWRETMDRRAQERRLWEEQWRQTMQQLGRERMMMEQAWREREEQRRVKEESRAERRDALITALLNKLIHGDV